jgi:uncharacterized membrane protein YccC
MAIDQLRALISDKENPTTVEHAIRTAVAGVASLLIARLCRLPEIYWSAITTMIVMQSSLGAALPVSAQRLAGTALGAAMGGVLGFYFPGNVAVFGVGVFVSGLLCVALHMDRLVFRYANITLAIVMLIVRANPSWSIALHRFVEVSVGIVVALAVSALWPEGSVLKRN